ncbi:MAG: hypothetical protein E7302_17640 [Butyrivibrio sp.]|nr:hypothetical protein [Butyrivibrio sp.]
MKNVILSHDGDSVVYSVPDIVAENLEKYCLEFTNWMYHSRQARRKHKIQGGFCYSEADFIDYLNQYIFPTEQSELVKILGWTDLGEELPDEYKWIPYFNF